MPKSSPATNGETQRLPVIADVDTGIDDALALVFLERCRGIDLRAITCVAGNTDVDQVLANTMAVLDVTAARVDLPVARGAERPLINAHFPAHGFHGLHGLGGLDLPPSQRVPYGGNAIDLMRTTVERSQEPVTLLALGPLTNVALFIRACPTAAKQLKGITFMGGAIGVGNATPVAEFNAWHDPEAMRIVLESGIPTTMYGLDVFHKPGISAAAARKLELSHDAGEQLVGSLLRAYASAESGPENERMGLGDAGAACFLADPGAGTVEEFPVNVELSGGARGQTIVDRRSRAGESELHGTAARSERIRVVTDVDDARIASTYLGAIDLRRAA